MMFQGETVLSGAQTSCFECGTELEMKVCRSGAGYYVGYWCDTDGPHTRETGYFKTELEAEAALAMYQATGELPRMRT